MEINRSTLDGQPQREKSQAYKTAPIAAIFEDCLQCFEQLESVIETDPEEESIGYSAIERAFRQFRQWGNDTGAPSRSLDHALRKASQLRQATEDLLQDLHFALNSTLEGYQNLALSESNPFSEDAVARHENSPSRQSVPSRASSDSGSSLQQLSEDIEECVSCLVKLGVVLKDPAPDEIYKEHPGDDGAAEDVEIARRMFPKASKILLHRLGLANWRRRKELLNMKAQGDTNWSLKTPADHRKHTSHPVLDFQSLNFRSSKEWLTAVASDHLVSSPGSSYTGAASADESIFSRADYFSSRTATSVAESENLKSIKRFEIPKPPIALKPGSIFDCAYCGQEIIFGLQVSSAQDWDSHVFLDLEPYVCTFDDCVRASKTFGVRQDWFRHELEAHRLKKRWSCQSCHLDYDEAEDIELHLSEKHKLSEDRDELSLMVSLCENYSGQDINQQPCPFCGVSTSTPNRLEDHIADHMEQLALKCIEMVYGPTKSSNVENERDPFSDGRVKMEMLNKFLDEQFGNIWKPSQKAPGDGSTDSHVAFAEDSSDDEGSKEQPFQPGPEASTTISKRPTMGRRANSWMKKVDSLLINQPEQENAEQPWLSKVEAYLEPKSRTEAQAKGGLEQHGRQLAASRSLEAQQGLTTPITTRCLRTRPPSRNKDFVGRESAFARLYESLSEPGTSVIVCGAGGIGKTETAIEFTYRYEAIYSYIFWVTAETAVSTADTYSLIASEFVANEDNTVYEQERLISLGREFLEQTKSRWLLVFDNVNSWSDIQQYIPTSPDQTSGSILITARTTEVEAPKDTLNCRLLGLEPLTLEESRTFLLKSVHSEMQERDFDTDPEYGIAGVVAKESEGLPLALRQIAGYVQVSRCTLTDFVQLWNERRRHKAFPEPSATSTLVSSNKTLENVWNIGLREVTIDAKELLNVLAFLDCETIQRKLLVGDHQEPSLEFLHSDQSFRYKRMIQELSRRNIIVVKTQEDEQTLSIHRLLQANILQKLDKEPRNRQQVFTQAFQLVRKKFPLPSPIQVPEPAKWAICREYLPHVLHLENVATKILPSIEPSVDLARLLSDGGINLWERGMTSEGLRLLESAEALLDKLQCEEYLLRANIHVIINLLIQDYGLSRIEESRERSRKALQIRLDYLMRCKPGDYTRNDNILLHNAWSDYGCVLLQYNDYRRAETMFNRCLPRYRDWGSESEIPYEYYKYNHHVAFCRMYQCNFSEAIRLAEKSLELITLATGHSSAANKTKFDLACIVFQSGDAARSLALHKEVLESNLRLHGKFNFLTLQSYYSVGVVSEYIGNLTEAEHLMRKTLDLASSRSGSDARSWSEAANARTEFHLSRLLLKKQGKDVDVEMAQTLASRARSVLTKLLPAGKPLHGVEVGDQDEIALFDHLQPVFDGRFAGRALLKYVS